MLKCSVEVAFDHNTGKLTLSPLNQDDETILDYLFTKKYYLSHTKKVNNGGSWVLFFSKEAVPGQAPSPTFLSKSDEDALHD